MENILDVETYKYKEQCNSNASIDNVLNRNNLCKIQAFSCAPWDCLFDTFQVLFHFRYSSIELRNGIIDHFFVSLACGDVGALESYQRLRSCHDI